MLPAFVAIWNTACETSVSAFQIFHEFWWYFRDCVTTRIRSWQLFWGQSTGLHKAYHTCDIKLKTLTLKTSKTTLESWKSPFSWYQAFTWDMSKAPRWNKEEVSGTLLPGFDASRLKMEGVDRRSALEHLPSFLGHSWWYMVQSLTLLWLLSRQHCRQCELHLSAAIRSEEMYTHKLTIPAGFYEAWALSVNFPFLSPF